MIIVWGRRDGIVRAKFEFGKMSLGFWEKKIQVELFCENWVERDDATA